MKMSILGKINVHLPLLDVLLPLVYFAAVFWDVRQQRSPSVERRCVTSQKTAAKENLLPQNTRTLGCQTNLY